ncbi:MAG TPA: hypothetical protein VFT45_14575 [Longimicrobium sp.]|nr:hypothetical protein [Longimicrobium sp.]
MDATFDAPRPAAPPPIIRRPAKKSPWRALLIGLLSGGAGALVGAGAIRLLGEDAIGLGNKAALRAALGPWAGLVVALTGVAMGWLAILAHEAGHIAGGQLARFRFHLLVAGPLRIERNPVTHRIRAVLNREISLYGGIAASLPTGTERLPRRLGLMVAGGPGASFLLAGIGAALVWGPMDEAGPLAKVAVGIMMLMSGGMGVVTLIPMRFSGFASDGARLLRLARGGPEAEREAAILSIMAISVAGTAPRDWPAETVRAAIAARDGSSDECTACLLAYTHALDRAEIDAARETLHRALELADQYPPAFVPALMVEAAFFEGFVSGDAAAARAYLAELPEKTIAVTPFDRLRAEAAVALAEGDAAGARERIERARAVAPAGDAFRRALLEQMTAAAPAAEAASA